MRGTLAVISVVTVSLVGVGLSSVDASAGSGAFAPPQVQRAFYDDHLDAFVTTDTSTKAQANAMSINYSPTLAALPRKTSPLLFIVRGRAAAGQRWVLGAEPGESDYSPIWNEVDVRWKSSATPVKLTSDTQIRQAAKAGDLTTDKPGILLNAPVIAENVTKGSTVHPPRVFRTFYDGHEDGMLATDVSTKAQATKEKINYAPALTKFDPEVFPELYIVRGTAARGQLMVLGSEPGEPDYSPLWRETIVRWKKGVTPTVITSDTEVDRLIKAGKVTEHETTVVLNCPVTGES
jgi:hypothetical protein